MELTPRSVETASPRTRRRPWAYLALAAIVVALGLVVFNGLSNATVYFRNADAAVADREDLGTKRFRLQGTVVEDSVVERGTTVEFQVEFAGTTVDVVHTGDPPELFRPGIPVVLEGHWSATTDAFESDRILVKHTPDYEAENPDRVEDYEDDTAP